MNPRTEKIDLPVGLLKVLYLDKKHSTVEIAGMFGCAKAQIRRRLVAAGVQMRSIQEAYSLSTANPTKLAVRGPRHPSWKGGRKTHSARNPYVMVMRPDHPEANREGYVFEHRLVMEQQLGRPLAADETIHHINGIKDDNRPENLAVMTHSEHMSLHMKEKHAAGKIPNPNPPRKRGVTNV